MESLWKKLPFDLIVKQLNYFNLRYEFNFFFKDPYINEKLCKDPNSTFWMNLYKKDFSDTISLSPEETIMNAYIDNKEIMSMSDANYEGDDHLITAAISGFEKIIERALNQIKNINRILLYACQNGHLSIIKLLIEHGANIHYKNDLPLRVAVFGHLSIVQYLIEQGADIYAENEQAVQLAEVYGSISVLRYLISKGSYGNPHSNICTVSQLDLFELFDT